MSEVVTRNVLESVVREIFADAERRVAREIVVARGVQRLAAILEGTERPAEQYRRENAEGLRWIAALGNARGAPLKAAQRVSPSNPSAHHRLAQRFRRLLREKK